MTTMIRINLLPVRAVKKREAGRQALVLIAAVLLLGLVSNYLWYSARDEVRSDNAQRIAQTQTRIADLEKVIGEVNNINKRKKEVQEKLKVLDDLRKGRAGPVRLLDALATATPKKVWLTGFDEVGGKVKLTGSASSHEDVAEMMRGLNNIVWTSKGIGRLVEVKKEAKTSRVELLSGEGAIEDFANSDIGFFFSSIELRRATQSESKDAGRLVSFDIGMSANYAL